MSHDLGIHDTNFVFNEAKGLVFDTALRPRNRVSAYRITFAIEEPAKLKLLVSDGTTTVRQHLFGGADIPEKRVQTLMFGVRNTYTYNFQFEPGVKVLFFQIDEVRGAVPLPGSGGDSGPVQIGDREGTEVASVRLVDGGVAGLATEDPEVRRLLEAILQELRCIKEFQAEMV